MVSTQSSFARICLRCFVFRASASSSSLSMRVNEETRCTFESTRQPIPSTHFTATIDDRHERRSALRSTPELVLLFTQESHRLDGIVRAGLV